LINLSSPFESNSFQSFISDFLPDFVSDDREIPELRKIFPRVKYLGQSERLRTSVLVIETTLGISSRISLTKASFRILRKFGLYRALIVYFNPEEAMWRLSLLTAQPTWIDGRIIEAYSNPVRSSYALGPNVGVASARKFLLNLGQVVDFEDLQYRFSIEAINQEFYADISNFFYALIGRYDETGTLTQTPLLRLPGDSSHRENQEYAIRLFGRIIFCWFLKEKKSASGLALLPKEVFNDAVETEVNILHKVLEPLFFLCLNSPPAERQAKYSRNRYELVPYLNGGLFHPNEGPGGDYFTEKNMSLVEIPDTWFRSLFKILETYNFTLDEDLDFDVELAIDPEMLGRIFENLLAEINPESGESARKTSGSFYTPRRIVNYMTDISLKRYLSEKTDVDEVKLLGLLTIDTSDDTKHPLTSEEKRQVSEALYSLRSLDPACGSGAFPIGLLQKLVFILAQVDPQLALGKTKFPENYFTGRSHLAQNSDYLRKLILIRDVIHGVDIQPIAVEISKLRCFLTLIVEQEVLDDDANRGLDPLPNLDFQFVCANTLIKLDENLQASIWDDDQLEERLEQIRQDYYSTTVRTKRDVLKNEYLALVSKEISLFGESRRTTQLRSFQPFVPNSQATFFDTRSMFGLSVFDLIIGNPPYVKTEHFGASTKKELSDNYAEFRDGKKRQWVDDLYVHFIFRAFELVGDGGIVCLITNDSFIGLDSKARVREKLLQENLVELVACPKETFGATIYTAIFLATRSQVKDENYIGARFTFPAFDLVHPTSVSKSYTEQLPKGRLVFEEDPLLTKLLGKSTVGDFLRVMDTGIDSGNVRDKIFSLNDVESTDKRMIQGRQIKRWAVFWGSPDAKFRYCNPHYQPLDEFGTGRGGKKSLLKEYWRFRGDLGNHFLEERLLLRQTGDSLHAAYHSEKEDGQLYTDNTLFTVVLKGEGSLKYFLGLLNSKVMNYVYQSLSSEEGKTLAQVKIRLVEQLPAFYDKERAPKLEVLVDTLISIRRGNPQADVSEIEAEVDGLVCEIFGLSEEDTKLILQT